MRLCFRSSLAALLLSLLVWTWSGWAPISGWYCADGVQCKPAAASACCCEGRTSTPDRCIEKTHRHSATVASQDCGCYYQLLALDAGLQSEEVHPFFDSTLPPQPWAPLAPRLTASPVRFADIARPPPLEAGSSQITRGPPQA